MDYVLHRRRSFGATDSTSWASRATCCQLVDLDQLVIDLERQVGQLVGERWRGRKRGKGRATWHTKNMTWHVIWGGPSSGWKLKRIKGLGTQTLATSKQLPLVLASAQLVPSLPVVSQHPSPSPLAQAAVGKHRLGLHIRLPPSSLSLRSFLSWASFSALLPCFAECWSALFFSNALNLS